MCRIDPANFRDRLLIIVIFSRIEGRRPKGPAGRRRQIFRQTHCPEELLRSSVPRIHRVSGTADARTLHVVKISGEGLFRPNIQSPSTQLDPHVAITVAEAPIRFPCHRLILAWFLRNDIDDAAHRLWAVKY